LQTSLLGINGLKNVRNTGLLISAVTPEKNIGAG
jgi:hypothetical protein